LNTATSRSPTAILLGQCDVERLQRDYHAVSSRMVAERQPGPHHDGDWQGISLHSQGGQPGAKSGCAGVEPYRATAVLQYAAYFREILQTPWPKQVVRLLSLPPGGVIRSHFDYDTNLQYGLIRLHIPIFTHPAVEFFIDEHRCNWRPGELWYGDFTRPHRVANASPITRIHLVMDVEITDELLRLFPPDFVEQSERSGISKYRAPVALRPDELKTYECDCHIPASVTPILTFGVSLSKCRNGAPATLRATQDSDLEVRLWGKPAFRLQPLGEDRFGIMGLPAGCYMTFKRSGPAVSALTLTLKGVPRDLYAARLGAHCGPSDQTWEVDLPLHQKCRKP
jgi:hypothetical protein